MSSFRRFVLHQQHDAALKTATTTAATSAAEVLVAPAEAKAAQSASSRQPTRPALAQKDLNKPVQTNSTNTKPPVGSLPRLQHVQQIKPPARRSSGFAARDVLAPKFAGVTKPLQQPKASPALKRSDATNNTARSVPARVHHTPMKSRPSHPGRSRKSFATPLKKTPLKKKIERVATPEHPLYTAFREATTSYTTKTATQLPALLKTSIVTLSTALDNVSLHSQNLITASTTADLHLTTPFADEKLRFINPATKEETYSVLGARMTAFESVFQTERKRLRELWQRWDGVNERIQAMSVDTSTKAPVGNVDVDVDVDAEGKNYAIQYRKLQDEYQRKRDDILQRFEEANQGLVASVQAGEKKYEQSRKKQRQSFLQFMQAQMLEDEE